MKQATEDILFSEDDQFLITRGINNLYNALSNESEIHAGDLTSEKGLDTPNGWVVSPTHAAHCVKDRARTTHFLRGIYKAVKHYLTGGKQVQILYAGCGPFATLCTPLTTQFTPEEVSFTLLEINEVSLKAVKDLYERKYLMAYVDRFLLADATDQKIELGKRFDIIISETMQVALKREHQVSLTRNMVRFLKENGTFIPQKISLDLFMENRAESRTDKTEDRLYQGTVYELDYKSVPAPNYSTSVIIPENDLQYLKLYTTIEVFEDEKLTAGQSGLTQPLILDQFKTSSPQKIHFTYMEGPKPRLIFEYEQYSEGHEIPSSMEQGTIPVYHLKRYWAKIIADLDGQKRESSQKEHAIDQALLDTLGVGLHPALQFLYGHAPTFEEFESWIKAHTDLKSRKNIIAQFNSLFDEKNDTLGHATDYHLSEEDLSFFDEHGYVIIKQAVDKEACTKTVDAITNFIDFDLNDPETWYKSHADRNGIMVEFFKHDALEQNRFAPKIWGAFESLWKTFRLWVSTDRVSFNPPETKKWHFPGPNLHLDIQPTTPLPFGLQGILYLTDTEEDQGAFTVVPGFHKQIDEWMNSFQDEIPLIGVFDSYTSKPLAAEAGDFIIWHHALPHGSSPNTTINPRIVQYIKLYPLQFATEK